jgi:hypothetical protein
MTARTSGAPPGKGDAPGHATGGAHHTTQTRQDLESRPILGQSTDGTPRGALAAGWFAGCSGDNVESDYDSGVVLMIRPDWVLVDSDDLGEERWVHRGRFEAGEWWLA